MTTKNKNTTPKISVIITCYNYGKYIDEAIQSVQDQTFKDWELIIIDDCSTDESTRQKMIKLESEYKNISHIQTILSKKNMGVCKARNLGVRQTKGDYIIFLDGDDKLRKDCLEKMYNIIETGNYEIVGSGFQFFGNINKTIIRYYKKEKITTSCLLTPTSLIKKDIFLKIGGFRVNMTHGMEDHDLWIGLIEVGAEVYIIQEALLLYRAHSSESRGSKLEQESERGNFVKMQDNMVKNNPRMFLWTIENFKKQNKKLTKINIKLKIILGLSLIVNIIQILL